jgi:diguanylate cyclase (GGDEF)-like protein/PAS domain S-box-containing protein
MMEDLQQRLQLALASSQMAVWDSSIVQGNIMEGTVTWSAEGALLLGLEARPLSQPFRTFLTFVHPADCDHLTITMQAQVDACSDYEIDYRLVHGDGTVRWVTAKAQTICDAERVPQRTIGIIWDVSDRKAQELALARQKDLAEVTLSSIGDGVITTDAQGKVSFLNRIVEQLTGWDKRFAIGVDVDRLMHVVDEHKGEPVESVVRTCLRLRQAVGTRSRNVLVTREGRRIAIEDSAAPIWSHEGELLGAVAVVRDVSHERQLVHQLNWHAAHDNLTGLVNRREFENELAHALSTAKSEGQAHALLFIDLDRFAIINDTCGHGVGDLLLQLLSKMLQTHLRECDTLARLGGDELGVLLLSCPPQQAETIANNIREAIKSFRFPYDNRFLDLSASIGLVPINQDSTSMTELLIAADHACSAAKEQGRNRVHLYREPDAVMARRQGEMRWVARLNEALELERFRLFAQPIVPLHDQPDGHDEVLVRLDSGTGLIMPGDFLPAAERYDMMGSIDRWVVRNVCRHIEAERTQAALLEHAGCLAPAPPRLYSINLSGMSLNDDTMVEHITRQFDEYEVDPTMVCFEITETVVIANLAKAQQFIARLRALGCRFSLDDFGSGLSSFAYLRALHVDFLKIDGVFVRGIASNNINHALVHAINQVGHVMGICTVAEYVEDTATLETVRAIGIDYAQGYAVGKLRALSAAP